MVSLSNKQIRTIKITIVIDRANFPALIMAQVVVLVDNPIHNLNDSVTTPGIEPYLITTSPGTEPYVVSTSSIRFAVSELVVFGLTPPGHTVVIRSRTAPFSRQLASNVILYI